jgi:hypothetical protein
VDTAFKVPVLDKMSAVAARVTTPSAGVELSEPPPPQAAKTNKADAAKNLVIDECIVFCMKPPVKYV